MELKVYLFKRVSLFVLALSLTACASSSPNLHSTVDDSTSLEYSKESGLFSVANISVNVPKPFFGPQYFPIDENSRMYAFSTQDDYSSIIQISIIKPKQNLPEFSYAIQKEIVSRNLRKMISGIEARRKNYRQSDITYIDIDGAPMGKLLWTGDALGTTLTGAMYSFIQDGKTYFLSTQGALNNERDVKNAIRAIESTSRTPTQLSMHE